MQYSKILTYTLLAIWLLFQPFSKASTLQEIPPITSISIIPIPNKLILKDGIFKINSETAITFDNELSASANILKKYLYKGMDLNLGGKGSNSIEFTLNNNIKNYEGYKITINKQKLHIEASSNSGAFYAIETLKQLLPADFKHGNYRNKTILINQLEIEDEPRFEYRGLMLDVARHFFTVDEVKHTIDLLARYKINKLHLHLSDDQGWRIEIKSWPNLTDFGSKSSVKNEKGGFYTQLDYIEIQEYASAKHITIIPEIDMPGHTNAALSSYAELNCNNIKTEPYYAMKVGFSSLCVNKDITYKFIDDVIRELSDITTGKYIHIGGDESNSTKRNDFVKFINRARGIVYKHDKIPIGWDEIANTDIDSTTIVQYWGKKENAILAAKKGAKIILSPSDKIYLDMKYNKSTKLGLTWAGQNNVEDAYNWRVNNLIKGVDEQDVLGIEAPMWSETITTLDEMEYLVFPRLPGVAEIAWSKEKNRNWKNYKKRLGYHKLIFEYMNINYYKSELIDWK
ncbi:MAG: beta-N-acetylhexosaminidase [Ichthyobacteriaceae bacterium]|nr:beta-N-acetylhexosaminidase [Ichthyobacteriaceae bacterium]